MHQLLVKHHNKGNEMTTQIIRDTEGVITTGKFCTFNGKVERKLFCTTGDDYRYYKLVRMVDVEILKFLNSLKLTSNGISVPLIHHTESELLIDEPFVVIQEDFVQLRNQPENFQICSIYPFDLIEELM